MFEWLLEFFASASEGRPPGTGGNLLEGGAIDRGIDAIVQLFLWFGLFESEELNYSMNVVLGTVEALGGAVLISMGLRQVDLTGSADGEGLRRVARRTVGEVVKTVLGQILRIVGVVRASAGLVLLIGNLL
ncbi:MAG: hypothetical protein QNK04_09210 [Myxococcota bacterium]|nr:hypothetical protein [Myxococcota bacterium]